MDNYLMLNGKRVDLTEEQIETLGFEVKEDYFERGDKYFYITTQGNVMNDFDVDNFTNDCHYNVANYCKNEEMMKQRALREVLDRRLWRFSMQNDGDKIDWENYGKNKYIIMFDFTKKDFFVNTYSSIKNFSIYFYSKETAQRAIDEILKPFMEEHPDFVW